MIKSCFRSVLLYLFVLILYYEIFIVIGILVTGNWLVTYT